MKQVLNIFYLSNERFPAKLACTMQQMVMCEAFAKAGARVQLVHPAFFDMPPHSTREIQAFYNVEPCFRMIKLFSLLSLSKRPVDGRKHFKIPFVGGFSLLISTWFYAIKTLTSRELDAPTVVYSRNVVSAFVFLKLARGLVRKKNVKVIFEVHSLDQQYPRRFFHKLLRESDGLICITKALRDALEKKYGVSPEKVLVAPDGVKKNQLQAVLSKKEARKKLGILAERLVLYTGQILPGKGADVFIEAARFFKKDLQFVLVGGHGNYMKRLRQKVREQDLKNVELVGFVPPASVSLYQAAADILVLPATANHAISAYTSPLKLFEYMAARRPIVASNLPVLGEVLVDGQNVLLFQERDAVDLAKKIKTLLADSALQKRLVQHAWEQVQQYTWEKRARRILDFIQGGAVL